MASDVPAILTHTRDMFFLADGDMAILTPDGVAICRFRRPQREPAGFAHPMGSDQAEKGGYKHFMLKEIFEQPRAVRDTTLGRVGQETGRIFLDEVEITPAEFAGFKQVKIIACGTSWHAALWRQVHDREAGALPVRSGLRQRVSLPRSDCRPQIP